MLHYSHLKNLIATNEQISAIATITQIGNRILSIGNPKVADFNILIPCVNGKKSTIFCIVFGITSYGSVAPEKISIGKYNALAIMPATLEFLAMPPTIMPMLNIETITNIHPRINSNMLPCILKPKNIVPTAKSVSKEIKAYRKYMVTSTNRIVTGLMGVTLNRFKICLLL